MANHGYVTTRRHLTTEKLMGLLREVNEERFGGALKLALDGGTIHVEIYEGIGRPVWLASRHKVEIRHQGGGGSDLAWWVGAVIINDLALKLDGTISDEGVSGKWKGKPGKYPTAMDFVRALGRGDNPLTPFFRYLHYQEMVNEVEENNPGLLPFLGKQKKPEGFERFVAGLTGKLEGER